MANITPIAVRVSASIPIVTEINCQVRRFISPRSSSRRSDISCRSSAARLFISCRSSLRKSAISTLSSLRIATISLLSSLRIVTISLLSASRVMSMSRCRARSLQVAGGRCSISVVASSGPKTVSSRPCRAYRRSSLIVTVPHLFLVVLPHV